MEKMMMSSSSSSRRRRVCYGEVLPFTVMTLLQCVQVGTNILFKKAATQGLNYMAFVFYSYAVGAIVLLPFSVAFERKNIPRFTWQAVGRIILLGFLAFPAQLLGFKGIEYSSPTMASAMSNLIPGFTFALAVLFRMEKLEMKSLNSWAKILGAILSIAGALVVVLYEGPIILRVYNSSATLSPPQLLPSAHTNWVIGVLLLMGANFLLSLWFIFQTQASHTIPEMTLVCLFNLCMAAMAAPVTLVSEPLSAWRISTDMMWCAILYVGLFGISFGTALQTVGMHLKGPVYVALFTPMSIIIATVTGAIFLGDSLYLGSVIGAVIISGGFYLCVWGKAKEELVEEILNPDAAPLL